MLEMQQSKGICMLLETCYLFPSIHVRHDNADDMMTFLLRGRF